MLRTRIGVALAALGLLAGCSSLEPPKPIAEDQEFLGQLGAERIRDRRILIAPLQVRYAPRPLVGPPESAPAEGIVARYRPPLSPAQRQGLMASLKEDLALVTEGGVVDVLAEAGEGAEGAEQLRQWCRAAEDQGAELLMTVAMTDNSLSYRGQDSGWTLDLLMTIFFFPLNVYIHDEVFAARKALEVSLYDVRDPEAPLHSFPAVGEFEHSCNELEHQYIFLNAFSSGDDAERYQTSNWQEVARRVGGQADGAMRRAFALEMQGVVRGILARPDIARRLETGAGGTARLYSLCVGQNAGGLKYAEADAQALHLLLRERYGVSPAHSWLGLGALKKADILKAIDAMRTKQVDRILVAFAGQGRRNVGGQEELVLASGEALTVRELADALGRQRAGKVAIILDASFSASERVRAPFVSRTAEGSPAPASASGYLAPLLSRTNWRVLAAAPADASTAELPSRGHGLLTWLLLEELQAAMEPRRLDDIEESLSRPYARISQSLTGEPVSPLREAPARARPFILIPQSPRAAEPEPGPDAAGEAASAEAGSPAEPSAGTSSKAPKKESQP